MREFNHTYTTWSFWSLCSSIKPKVLWASEEKLQKTWRDSTWRVLLTNNIEWCAIVSKNKPLYLIFHLIKAFKVKRGSRCPIKVSYGKATRRLQRNVTKSMPMLKSCRSKIWKNSELKLNKDIVWLCKTVRS